MILYAAIGLAGFVAGALSMAYFVCWYETTFKRPGFVDLTVKKLP